MGKYTNYFCGEYYDLLSKIYRWTPRKIESVTGGGPEAVRIRNFQRYPNDRHILAMRRALDELGFHRSHELQLNDINLRHAYGLAPPPTAIRLIIGELRNSADALDLLECAVRRFGGLGRNSNIWLEYSDTSVRVCHQYVDPDEATLGGPQGFFLFLLSQLVEVFCLEKDWIKVHFAEAGIRDEAGFVALSGFAFDTGGAISSIELTLDAARTKNVSFNPLSRKAVGEALEDLLALPEASDLSTSVEQLLEQNLEHARLSLDIEAVAQRLGMSRATLHRRLRAEGNAFKEIRIRTRLLHASRLLRSSGHEITAISQLLGYSEVSAFSRAFKSYHGCSPNEFRARFNSSIGADERKPLDSPH